MITVPTHKHHKSPFKHPKTIYVFISGPLIVTVQIHSRKKILQGWKMTTAKSTSIQECSRIRPILLEDLMKRSSLQACGGAAPRAGARIKPKFSPLSTLSSWCPAWFFDCHMVLWEGANQKKHTCFWLILWALENYRSWTYTLSIYEGR